MPAAKRSKSGARRKPTNKAAKIAKRATKTVSRASPRRNVTAAATKVEKGAKRARNLGAAVVTAGEMIQQGADVAQTLAANIKKRKR